MAPLSNFLQLQYLKRFQKHQQTFGLVNTRQSTKTIFRTHSEIPPTKAKLSSVLNVKNSQPLLFLTNPYYRKQTDSTFFPLKYSSFLKNSYNQWWRIIAPQTNTQHLIVKKISEFFDVFIRVKLHNCQITRTLFPLVFRLVFKLFFTKLHFVRCPRKRCWWTKLTTPTSSKEECQCES